MTFYSRKQVIELLEVDDGFLTTLEQEGIVIYDAPDGVQYSERMLERVRVAQNMIRELDVNLPGAAVIVRMREELTELHGRLEQLARELHRLRDR